MSAATEPFAAWALVEIMGHQRAAGRVTEQIVAGAPMLRIEIPTGPESNEFLAQYINTASIFRMTPTTEEIVRQAVRSWEWRPPRYLSLPPAAEEDCRPLATDCQHSWTDAGGVTYCDWCGVNA